MSPLADTDDAAPPAPSVELLASVMATVPRRLSGAKLVAAVRDCERLTSWLAGHRTRLLADLARPGRAGEMTGLVQQVADELTAGGRTDLDPEVLGGMVADHAADLAAAEIGAALHLSPLTARPRVDRTVELVTELPQTLAALELGQIDRARAGVIADATAGLTPEQRASVEDAVLPKATTRTPGRLRPIVDRAAIAVDPECAERRARKARTGREVAVTAASDGMAFLRAHLPAEAAATVMTLLDLLAHRPDPLGAPLPGDPQPPGSAALPDRRTIGARRADALTDLCDALLTRGHVDLRRPDGHDPDADRATRSWQGRRPHLVVTMGLSTLAGLDSLPGELTGHGVITAEVARSLAESAGSLTVVPVDPPTGTAVGVGDRSVIRYRPGQQVRDRVLTAQDTCRFPGCRQSSRRCDLDHVLEFDHSSPAEGGPTDETNLIPLCRRHHRLKTFTLWRPLPADLDGAAAHRRPPSERLPLGVIVWSTPTGGRHTVPAREFTLPGELTDPSLGRRTWSTLTADGADGADGGDGGLDDLVGLVPAEPIGPDGPVTDEQPRVVLDPAPAVGTSLLDQLAGPGTGTPPPEQLDDCPF
ncbi:HNH endonuclease signature motif containing protein [Nakamurella leprariae]|uniref:DUF222 domain-containing protein n=1 Tax=Nakamurella leprariae TaxID=2803911 RepID=A0A938YCA9_9ACTN|nr:HNH endonuclease signature motif containing protein [Nakamurella leprariae]MBM9466971.1 DUF222 domain-containing protein [Nakamurella leprariae]